MCPGENDHLVRLASYVGSGALWDAVAVAPGNSQPRLLTAIKKSVHPAAQGAECLNGKVASLSGRDKDSCLSTNYLILSNKKKTEE